MQTTDDYKFRLKNLTAKFDDCCKAFDVHKMNERAAELDKLQSDPNLYSDPKRAAQINSEAKYISDKLAMLRSYRVSLDDIATLIELIEAEPDESLVAELDDSISAMGNKIEDLHLETLLKGEYDATRFLCCRRAPAERKRRTG